MLGELAYTKTRWLTMSAVKILDFDDQAFNPFIVSSVVAGQGAVTDIYGELKRLRQIKSAWELDPRLHFGTAPDLTLEGFKKWTVLRHSDVNRLLTDVSLVTNTNYLRNLGKMFGRSITTMDPPEHRKYRALFQQAFLPNMLDKWRTTLVPQIINELIDAFVGRGKADLVSEFALHFPFHFVMNLLQLPREDWKIFHKLAFAQTTIRYDVAHATEAGQKLTEYIRGVIDERRRSAPAQDDFLQVIATAEVEGERLPEDVLIGFFRQLMNAAGDTSYHGFSSMVAGLLRHPDQFAAVRNDRTLIDVAIDEGLRWEPPIVYVERMVREPLTLDGGTIQPGDHIFVAVGSANRDEQVWEEPDRYNIGRKRQRNLSFGGGPHVCIGQHLARMEMNVALRGLLDRLPNLRLDPSHPPPIVHGVTMRKPESVHVIFD
jgi:cytochrome P450